ncbi:GAF and ANTAR domain-containing protein [Paenibacillus sp. TRM 82003]|uniref:GAF and ANTAR domain-containing protein n=1 Tax=Kineococcus sp. TRM81007 TaxID=2925831 RepID=UPI001F59757C|nr:GAF and ANTAR domain-containing protein [Kineococcus sp. TRM81007]MCI2239255.1 GAF and ANTAR domain-containing protein [Kineococcus sp. TRM81007]MCI3924937.1 GAF and ANTAR domain-containing protein [Paenibacillus sp. TRM 82003]
MSDPTTPQQEVAVLADAAEALSAAVGRAREVAEAGEAVVQAFLTVLPGLRGASVTVRRGPRATTVAASGEEPLRGDELQYAAGAGPCLEAIASGRAVHVPDVGTDERWPHVVRRFTDLGVGSVLSMPLVPPQDLEWAAGLNVYAVPGGLPPAHRARADLLVAVAAGAVTAFAHRQRAANLAEAVASNRDIGAAVGVLMALRKITREQAVADLRRVSQHANRKLRDVATEVLETGELAEPGAGTGRPAPR